MSAYPEQFGEVVVAVTDFADPAIVGPRRLAGGTQALVRSRDGPAGP